MKNAYDVIVVGAGPAEAAAAIRAAQGGLDTLVVEKRPEIGVPVRCGEATDIHSTEQFMPLDPHWINRRISQYVIYNTAGEHVAVPPSGETIIVNRKVFDAALAQAAAQAGAQVQVNTTVVDLLREDGMVTGVRLQSFGQIRDVRARLVVAADGTESQVARWAGLKTNPLLADYYVGVQYLLGGLRGRLHPDQCEYHVGRNTLAPGGYAWVLPKSEDTANVGVVIAASQARDISAQTWLDRFVARRCPGASILSIVAGGIPVTGALRQMVVNGLVTVGDAAHQADPLTAGGIGLGMIGADLAMQVAVPAVRAGDVSARVLREYERVWQQRFGRMHSALYAIRRILTQMDEAQFDALVRTASQLPLDQMTLGQILLALLSHHPGLLLQSRTLIATGLVLK